MLLGAARPRFCSLILGGGSVKGQTVAYSSSINSIYFLFLLLSLHRFVRVGGGVPYACSFLVVVVGGTLLLSGGLFRGVLG